MEMTCMDCNHEFIDDGSIETCPQCGSRFIESADIFEGVDMEPVDLTQEFV